MKWFKNKTRKKSNEKEPYLGQTLNICNHLWKNEGVVDIKENIYLVEFSSIKGEADTMKIPYGKCVKCGDVCHKSVLKWDFYKKGKSVHFSLGYSIIKKDYKDFLDEFDISKYIDNL